MTRLKTLYKYRDLIEQSIADYLDKIEKEYKLDLIHPILYKSIREFSLREGKRIRPLLLVLAYKGYCSPKKRVSKALYNAATCIEFLHNFMLIHDDIIDRSDLRRGKPTMHKMLGKVLKTREQEKLGYDLAIVAGDIVYALAIDAFLSIPEDPLRKEKGLKYFIQTAAFTAMGEFIDTLHGVDKLANVKEKDVFLNYALKTARYTFDCPLVTGAILAGADNRETKKLSNFGLYVGQAFQIQDDVIGIFETEERIGKSILSDLAESKKTLLVTHAYDHLKGKKRKDFISIFNKENNTLEDLDYVRKVFIDSGSLEYCLDYETQLLKKSLKILKNLKISDKYRGLIEEALQQLFKQTKVIADQNNLKFDTL